MLGKVDIATTPKTVACIGAGPAGLTAAYLLAKQGHKVYVYEEDPVYVGGISKTVKHKGFRFDIGGHRFFSKSKEVEDFWTEILGDKMLHRPRSSRILYNKKFFSYPLKAMEAFLRLGPIESVRCTMSYFIAKFFPVKNPTNFQDWVSNHFGKRLFSIFFKTYTEKVWGMSCKEISADWAAQRIKGLSLGTAIYHAFFPQKKKEGNGDVKKKDNSQVIKTLIDTFRYPKEGPGLMWEVTAEKIKQMGGKILMGRKVVGLTKIENSKWKLTLDTLDDGGVVHTFDHVISSSPMRQLINGIDFAPMEVKKSAESLKYRDFITVALMVNETNIFNDNWIYIHDPSVKVGRIQNFKSWSPFMVPDQKYNCFGLEYFCFEGDGLWTSKDEELIQLAKNEIVSLGLIPMSEIRDGVVIRQKKAYPVYDDFYKDHVETIRKFIAKECKNLHLVGRNGMHKYNNQDHAMMTAMLTVENIIQERDVYDIWNVNQDAEYHESGNAGDESTYNTMERKVPMKIGKIDQTSTSIV